MPTVILPFLNSGKPFEPTVLIEDVEDYEKKEDAARVEVVPGGPRLAKSSMLLRARRDWLQKILGQTEGYEKAKEPLVLTAPQITQAFWVIWKATAGGGAPDPLE